MIYEHKFTKSDRYRLLGVAIDVLHRELIESRESGEDPADMGRAAVACIGVLAQMAKEIEHGD